MIFTNVTALILSFWQRPVHFSENIAKKPIRPVTGDVV